MFKQPNTQQQKKERRIISALLVLANADGPTHSPT
jgi:hypothetical protein